jgi:hypothetical protein
MIFLTYLQTFDLGLYCASEFKFNTPIEAHRWVITSFLFVMLLIGVNNTKK